MSDPGCSVVGMKIYCISVTGHRTAPRHTLMTGYQSATQSHAYWERETTKHGGTVTFTVANVPSDLFKPVDKSNEERLNRVAVLWEQLATVDPEGLDALLDDLVRRVQPKPEPEPVAVLPEEVKSEARILLDRLI